MIPLTDNPMDALKRQAIRLMLGVMGAGGVLTTVLHGMNPQTPPISRVIPPLTVIVCVSLLIYLSKYPQSSQRIIHILLAWSFAIIVIPEYFSLLIALSDPSQQLVDILPPIVPGIFLLTSCMIVFLNPRSFLRVTLSLWAIMAGPLVLYLLGHPKELVSPRGLDLMVALLPAMGMNIGLISLYSRLQDTVRQFDHERFSLKEASERDVLTGIYNRRAGEQILQSLIEQAGQSIGLILCDIDHFKQVNDGHGHQVGDRVIQAVTQCLQSHLRKQDILMRWGGEEFLIVVVGEELKELMRLAERLRYQVASHSIPTVGSVTASFGIALQHPAEPLHQLFERADQGLYQAKATGRNRVCLAST
jgi:diguanylate cyclase (GGDEF)-like protein